MTASFPGALASPRVTTQLTDRWQLGDGKRLLIRPILGKDDLPLGNLVRRLSPDSRRQRFHGGVRALSDATLRDMSNVDFVSQVALVATLSGVPPADAIVADARFVVDEAGRSAEFAIMVDDPWQRFGIGARLMVAMLAASASSGLAQLRGSVMKSNKAMLALADRCGFQRDVDPNDPRLLIVRRASSGIR